MTAGPLSFPRLPLVGVALAAIGGILLAEYTPPPPTALRNLVFVTSEVSDRARFRRGVLLAAAAGAVARWRMC